MATSTDRQPQKLPRGRHGLSREVIEQSQRQRILDGMVEVVAAKGYLEATIADAIAVAGISRKTFYEIFSDKEDCFLAAYDQWLGVLLERTNEAYESEPGAPWAERLRLGFAAFVGTLAENPSAAKLCIVESLAAGPKALARRDSAMHQLGRLVEPGRAETSFELPGITAQTLVGGVEELLYSEIVHGATGQLPSLLPDIVFCLTYPFLGAERAGEERDRTRALQKEASAAPEPAATPATDKSAPSRKS